MVRRRIGEGKLSWQLPAGDVEPGESREDIAVRETEEETGQGRSAVPPTHGPVRCPVGTDGARRDPVWPSGCPGPCPTSPVSGGSARFGDGLLLQAVRQRMGGVRG
ncbi:hypothetical protein GCM10010211_60680 [Streptomyces albospinus]|uniref:Nudix hydrolase domain-containing protein n=1 Tax=Streptomyces albospinus TaxID=285515 RepID=A0ABQ2VHZ3_9ACTN|nr:hypothetical protein GCM10010211_60680 [Streptomyces albospinus]